MLMVFITSLNALALLDETMLLEKVTVMSC